MASFLAVLAAILLVPYLGWGVYTLRLRYAHHEELSPITEAVTLTLVAAFFFLELAMLRAPLSGARVLYIFSALGLMVSAAALYGPMVVSITSRFFVDMVMPKEPREADRPNYGPADRLEEIGDYEGALQEYFVMARIFPKDTETILRIGHAQAKLKHFEDAVNWLERGLKQVTDPDRALRLTNRLCELLNKECGDPARAEAALERYLERFPQSERHDSVFDRLEKMRGVATVATGSGFDALPTREIELEPEPTVELELDPDFALAPEEDLPEEEPEGEPLELELPELEIPEERLE